MSRRVQCFGCDAWFTPKTADDLFCEKCKKEFNDCRHSLRERNVNQLELFNEPQFSASRG